ncbi:Reverse transcriptase domain [Dillenia turbinata]|uniref:Reverse transcriptase domain n=1 Tax=Dillenia turbinata TaxID=194707 RepID=A0AAN8ZGM4_9MAGN
MPEDRSKTTFCIPDHHFQWTVIPFGLKTAPSKFQKAMLKIYGSMVPNILIYIDDILLFSDTVEKHLELLQRFHQITIDHRIMLSEKKMIIEEKEIDFLGMKIKDGRMQLQPHIASLFKIFQMSGHLGRRSNSSLE